MPDTPSTPKGAVLAELKGLAKLYRGRAQLSSIGLVGAFLTSLMLFFFANAIGPENDQDNGTQLPHESIS